ncbi:hypothetical protein JXB41_05265 [Candidatus Woesearchaeota archaeon]|nr:hypothetical protein [Candidatus Woesearchaeota archaeon]
METAKQNKNYDFKSVKIRSETYRELLRAKAKIEYEQVEKCSFDRLIGYLLQMHKGIKVEIK